MSFPALVPGRLYSQAMVARNGGAIGSSPSHPSVRLCGGKQESGREKKKHWRVGPSNDSWAATAHTFPMSLPAGIVWWSRGDLKPHHGKANQISSPDSCSE
jgi:hypothetical protein